MLQFTHLLFVLFMCAQLGNADAAQEETFLEKFPTAFSALINDLVTRIRGTCHELIKEEKVLKELRGLTEDWATRTDELGRIGKKLVPIYKAALTYVDSYIKELPECMR